MNDDEIGLNEGWFINPFLVDDAVENEGKIYKM